MKQARKFMSTQADDTRVLNWEIDDSSEKFSTGTFKITDGSSYIEFYIGTSNKNSELKAIQLLIAELQAFHQECLDSL